jgi:hypothetical protein
VTVTVLHPARVYGGTVAVSIASSVGGLRSRRSRVCLLLWGLVVAAATVRIVRALSDAVPLRGDWRTAEGGLLDARDLIVIPGRFLWAGGNPYDPSTYLAAHPWAQEFDPYAPAWLLLSSVLAPLPDLVARGTYLVLLMVVAVYFAIVLARWTLPASAWWVAPLVVLWLNVWYPGRNALQDGSSFIVITGLLLALRSLDASLPSPRLAGIAGVAVTLLKPQFGVPVCILLLACGAWRTVWRGIVVCAAASVPIAVACTISAGGPAQFVQALLRDVQQASSPNAPTGLLYPGQSRTDPVGLFVRLGGPVPSSLLEWAFTVMVVGLGAVLLTRRRAGTYAPLIVVPVLLLSFVHASYDLAAALIPMFIALRLWWWRPGDRRLILLALVSAVPVLHVHRVTMTLLGASAPVAHVIDVTALLLTAVVATLVPQRLYRDEMRTRPGGRPDVAAVHAVDGGPR